MLGRFSFSERLDMEDAFDRAARAAAALVTQEPEAVMNLYNKKEL